MFRGKHLLVLDNKGRFAVPKRYREQLWKKTSSDEIEVVVTIDPYETCLVVYPLDEWTHVEERLGRHPGRQPDAEEEERVKADWIFRQVVGNAEDCTLDSHGRLLIPSDLRRHLGLEPERQESGRQVEQEKQQVRLIGQIEKFELWNESTWSVRSTRQFERNKGIAERVMSGGPAAA